MRIKTIVDEDFVNYMKPSMFIGAVSCGGKCCTEAGIPLSVCQNDSWRSGENKVLPNREVCERYLNNQITQAVVFGGLEPMEQFDEIVRFLITLRNVFGCNDDVVIYTGYNHSEIEEQIERLKRFPNIIIKFGRYVPWQKQHFDDVLGVYLSSDNQYAKKIS